MIVYILAALLVFGVLIAVHELGHFLAAKACGVRVNEFSIGMGPALWKKQKGDTQYSLRAFPVGFLMIRKKFYSFFSVLHLLLPRCPCYFGCMQWIVVLPALSSLRNRKYCFPYSYPCCRFYGCREY